MGSKTAIRLLTTYGRLEGIYENLEKVTPDKLRSALGDNRDRAFQGKMLTTIVRDVPLELDLEAARFWRYDRTQVVDLLRELEFFSIVSHIPSPKTDGEVSRPGAVAAPDRPDTNYVTVDTEALLEELVGELATPSGFSFDTETTSTDPMLAELVGISFSIAPGRGWYVPVGHLDGNQLPLDRVLETLRPILESETIPKECSQRQLRHDGFG